MPNKTARANLTPVRQRTQFTCVPCSLSMALSALGLNTTEDEVNKVLGARPMKGASWEQVLAAAQHYGCRATLTMPSTVEQLKRWTDAEIPVLIAWNPEGRDWSHASTVFHVHDGPIEVLDETQMLYGDGNRPGLWVYVADPNLPNPKKLVRIMHEDDFYGKWYEKWPDYLVRRPAVAIEREITSRGRQVMATWRSPIMLPSRDELGGSREIGRAEGRKIVEKQRRELAEYVEYNYGMTPMKAVEQWLRDNRFMGTEVEGALRRQLQDIARKMASSTMKLGEAADCWRDYNAGGMSKDELRRCLESFGAQNRYPQRPRPQKVPVPVGYAERIKKLMVALWFNSSNASKFIRNNMYARELSPKQLQWFEQLEQQNSRITRDLPDDFRFTTGTDGSLWVGENQPSLNTRGFEKHFDMRPGRFGWQVLPKSKAPASPSPGRFQFGTQRQSRMVAALLDLYNATRKPMFKGFIQDLESGKGLTENQLKAARRQLYQMRRRPDADLFRVASQETKMATTFTDNQGRTWGPKRGLEGPFKFRSGVVLYYDYRENGGQYYDPSTDMYVANRDFASLTGENWERRASSSRVADTWLFARKGKGRGSQPVQPPKDKDKTEGKAPKRRNEVVRDMVTRGWGSGAHGGGKKTKNRRDRQKSKRELRQHQAEEN